MTTPASGVLKYQRQDAEISAYPSGMQAGSVNNR
jgi:hypothetical protein